MARAPLIVGGEPIEDEENYERLERDLFDRQKYCGCYVPEGYVIASKGIYRIFKKSSKDGSTAGRISNVPIMITGKYTSSDDVNDLEVTFVDGAKVRVERVSQSAILDSKEFKKYLLAKNLPVTGKQFNDVSAYLTNCITENELASGTAFKKDGKVSKTTGWVDETCTQYIAGEVMYCENPQASSGMPAIVTKPALFI
jgi:Domain of unknown function (DUF927).